MNRSFALVATIACAAIAANGADTLEEAFKNGKASGDVSAYYESRHVDKGDKSTYFNNTAWAIGSVGLKYETIFTKALKAS